MDRRRGLPGLLPLLLLMVWFTSSTEGIPTSEIQELLKKAKGDILRMDLRKLQPGCKKAMTKCRTKGLVILQVMKMVQENPEPYMESPCLIEYLRSGVIHYDMECDMAGKFGEELQCFRDSTIKKALGAKHGDIGIFVNCLSENSLNYNSKDPQHRF